MFTDFKDSSTNDLAITANGDAQLVKSIKKYGNAAGYFDGDGDYLELPSNDGLIIGSGDFTVEFWMYPLSWVQSDVILGNSVSNALQIGRNESDNTFGICNSYIAWILTDTEPSINTWTHIAVSRSSGVLKLFFNGIEVGSIYDSTDFQSPSIYIGGYGTTGTQFNGYIDELRITKGIARYTSNFTPPTQQLPDPSDQYGANVSLLLHMDGNNGEQTFTDSSLNNFAITVNGDTYTDTSLKKFGNASAFFNGTTDYLELPNNQAFDFGSGDFTIECWFYSTSTGFQSLITRWGSTNVFFMGVDISEPNIQFYVNGNMAAYGGSPQINEWNHIAAVRSGTSIKLFLNGTQVGTTYNIGTTAITIGSSLLRIGADENVNPKFQGYIDEVRITKGFARYTSNFVPQTAPFANPILPQSDPYFNNVSLLLHMDGTQGSQVFTDSSSNNFTITVNGDAQIDTAIKQFGTGSASFDGDGDYIAIPDDTSLNFSSSDDFTIEGWIYFNSLSDGVALISKGGNGTQGWTLYYYSGTLYLGVPYVSNDISATFTPSLNTWYYLACSRQSGTARLFIDGIKVAESSNSVAYSSISPVRIGYSHSNNFLDGYVDEIRITKGVARYTSNFTIPAAPFLNQ